MNLRIVIEFIRGNGQSETTSHEFNKNSIIIGRGGKSDLSWNSDKFSAEHVRLSLRDESLFVEDLQSIGGVRVNGHLIQRQELRSGDTIRFGDVIFTVSNESNTWELSGIRRELLDESLEESADNRVRRLDIRYVFPSIKKVSALVVVFVVLLFFIFPLLDIPSRRGAMVWSSGQVSSAHMMIEHDCQACHAHPFKPVQDETCLACHEMTDHAVSLVKSQSPHAEERCASCHFEHNGSKGITVTESKLCTGCHENLLKVISKADMEVPELRDVIDFRSHPEFAVTIHSEDGYQRVSLDDAARLLDPARIQLNHAVHLQDGLMGPDGTVQLGCDDCHRLTPDTKTFSPISYERDCSSCHGLEFDERLPGVSVPHGDAEIVYNFAYAEYAKLFLDIRERPERVVPGFERFKPGAVRRKSVEQRAFVHNEVDVAARGAEEQLFTKKACHLCHTITEKTSEQFSRDGEHSARFIVQKPNIPDVWMPKAHFAHAAHQEIKCESCHEGVRASESTRDVLLPGVESCKVCHSDVGVRGKVPSECVLCHSFHESKVLPEEKRRELAEFALFSFTEGREDG
ncbi:FHA domain-containing protein [bacterium]|nr:FHA domain-containing protein [bacterium]